MHIKGKFCYCTVVQLNRDATCQVEIALASAERQIERLKNRERMHARGLVEARHQLVEASSASSVISEDGPLTPEAGLAPALMSGRVQTCHHTMHGQVVIEIVCNCGLHQPITQTCSVGKCDEVTRTVVEGISHDISLRVTRSVRDGGAAENGGGDAARDAVP